MNRAPSHRMSQRIGIGAALSVALVSAYLGVVALWLLGTRRIHSPGLGKFVHSLLRGRQSGLLLSYSHESGHCHVANVPARLLSDKEAASWLQLFEDGKALGPAHCPHEEVRQLGMGRFAHWGSQIYFSSSDNSDPSANGRKYVWREVSP